MDNDIDHKLEQILAARMRQEALHTKRLVRLLDERADLRGVHALADFVGERVLWCA